MATATPFEPARHLTRISGSDYLEVKWRLVWLRDQHPDAAIETQLVSHGGEEDFERAVFKATISIPGGGSATGYGSETVGDFRDFIEKAETKAIGRALAALGFGTQFAPDHDFGAASGRVVDSPVKSGRPRPIAEQNGSTRETAGAIEDRASVAAIGPDQPATQRQLRYLQAVAREAGLDGAGLDERAMQEYGVQAAALNRRDCSALIDVIQSGKQTAIS